MKIAVKLKLVGSASICILLGVCLALYWGYMHTRDVLKQDRIIDQAMNGAFELNVLTNNYLFDHTERSKKQWYSRHDSLTDLIDKADDFPSHDTLLILRIKRNHADMKTIFNILVERIENSPRKNEGAGRDSEFEERFSNQLLVKAQTVVTNARQLSNRSNQARSKAQRIYSLIITGFLFLFAVGMCFITFFINKRITNPINKLRNDARIIGRGNFFHTIASDSRDEIGDLSKEFEQMARNLSSITVSRDSLTEEIKERKKAEAELKQYSENLESMVEERTEELKETQRELIRQEKLVAIGKLSGSVAHDIRNPLGVISNSIYYLNFVSNEETDEKIREHISIMEREINRANEIINDLMNFSRENTPNLSKGDMNRLIGEYVEELQLPDNILLETELDPALPILAFDHSQLHRIFHNLLTNARQSMPDGGALQIRTSHDNEFVRIAISDTGRGIAGEDLDKIFEPLFTTRTRGVGLGLSIVKDFIEKHGGAIEVESELGKGTTFTVRLPVKGR